jgi:hypothetical protein
MRPSMRRYCVPRLQFFRLKVFCEFVIFPKRFIRPCLSIFYSIVSLHLYINVFFYQHTDSQIKEQVEVLFMLGKYWKKRK